jgi:hypothetical protein
MEIIIFIDKNMPDYNTFISGIKENIHIKSEIQLDSELDYKPNIDLVKRIGLVWDNIKSLIPFGSTPYQYQNESKSKYFTKEIISYLSKYTNKLQVDLITCMLDSLEFRTELVYIQKILPNVTFAYSNSYTGNSPKGNWILESSDEDISQIYFTEQIINYTHVLGYPPTIPNFDTTYAGFYSIYTLTTDFTIGTGGSPWTRVDMTYDSSFSTQQLIIDGNNKTITINDVGFDGLFIAGYTSPDNKPTILRNFNIVSNVNIKCALAVITGYTKFENCTLNLYGNILNNGGGICYNDGSLISSSGINTQLTDCSTIVFGKIGENAGPIIGYIAVNSGNVYNLENCLSVISDNNSSNLITPFTLGSSAGAFVGSGVSNTASINNSYCIFNGSMSNGSGIIGGKFLGNGTLTINKFYAITNITYAPTGSGGTPAANSAYILSSYFGGSVFSSSSLSNVNILNLGQNLQNIYCNTLNIFTTLTGLSLYTEYSSFSSSANTPTARIGEYTYTINYSGSDKTFYSFYSSPLISWIYNLTSVPSTLQGISQLSSFTIDNQNYSNNSFTPTLPTILVGNGNIITYSSSNPLIASVNSTTGEITMYSTGTVTIIATLSGTSEYVQSNTSATFNILGGNNKNKYSKKYLIKKINKLFKSGLIDEATKKKLLEYIELKKYDKVIKFLHKLDDKIFNKSLVGTNNVRW